MADTITKGPATPDQHGPSTGGDPTHMPDGTIWQANSLGTVPGGPVGTYCDAPSPDNVPGSQEITPREQYGFQSPGEPGLLGQDQDDYSSTLKDANYPTVPNVALTGGAGTTNMGQQGDALDWNTVGKYQYPEYPVSPASPAHGGRARVQDPN